jgi:hypothetical protein
MRRVEAEKVEYEFYTEDGTEPALVFVEGEGNHDPTWLRACAEVAGIQAEPPPAITGPQFPGGERRSYETSFRNILEALHNGPLPGRDLAARAGYKESVIYKLCRLLKLEGLIRRCKQGYLITPKGRAWLREKCAA